MAYYVGRMNCIFNNEILAKAELIRCRRQEAVINEEFGFMDRHKMRADFMAYCLSAL